ncbi:MAG TPA: flagellar biosynthesis protein FlhA [Gemmataceae bacterium]|nr:flagellar biosynthesis protein FlhA [Gemmataceae bacterium]
MTKAMALSSDSNLSFAPRSELVLSVALLGVLVVLLVPLPPALLDLLLATNLALTILLLLVTLGATKALDFSVFPSLLLLMTLFRLALNVATTRLILLKGNAGHIVETFGGFVVGGSLVVGLVIFLILIIIQFVVITKGAGRVSEVAARFTLDGLPGKQVAIDAELNSGAIDEAEARRRRQTLLREAEFYGAMDGASKFVRGDAIAALIITAINLVGGFVIGLMHNMTITQAFRTYSILSVGDGLISQIPALIIATASGMLVTKATTQTSLGVEIGAQMAMNPRPLYVGALILLGLALAPGLPMLPFVALAGLLYFGARRMMASGAASAPREAAPRGAGATPLAGPAKPAAEVHLDDFLQTDRATVEIGARLIPLVDPRRGNGLLDRIGGLRRDLARKNGIWVPPIRLRDNIQLEADTYRILIGGREVARGRLRPERLMAIEPAKTHITVAGEATKDPAFGLAARWINENDRQRAELGGYTVVDAPSVLITHLGEIVRKHASELFSREDLKTLLDKTRETNASVVDELLPNILSMGALHRILCLLLEEHVPISNLPRILESLAHHAPATKEPLELTERVRVDLGRVICDRYRDAQGRLHAVVLDPRLEMEWRRMPHDKTLAIDPGRLEKMIAFLLNEWRKASARGQEIALLTDTSLRRPLRHALLRGLPDLAIIAYQEVPGDLLLEPAAMLRPEDLAGTRPLAA